MNRRTANVIGAAALTAAMLFGAAALQAQQAAPQSIATSGGTVISIRAQVSGWVHVDARRGMVRVGGWYAPSAIDAWATEAERLLAPSASGQGLEVAKLVSSPAAGERVEYKTPLLFSADTGAVVLDRIEQQGAAAMNLYLADKGSAHRMYVPLAEADARAFVSALRDAAALSRQLATAAAAEAAALRTATTSSTRAGGK